MSETAITTSPPAPLPYLAAPARTQHKGPVWYLRKIIAPVASLRLTVFLFSLSIFLVFAGTLAQVDWGIWTVLHKYFRSYVVWIPFQVFVRFGQIFLGVSATKEVGGSFPFPGGWVLGLALLVNLLAAHFLWFVNLANARNYSLMGTLILKRSGILLLHSGVVVMMLGEMVTGLFAVEGNMVIEQGHTANYVQHTDTPELAIVDVTDSVTDDVAVIPGALLQKGRPIKNELLPFDVEVVRYMVNSAIPKKMPTGADNPATTGEGLVKVALDQPEVSGTDPNQKINVPSAYVTLKDKETGQALGTYLVSLWIDGQSLSHDGKKYNLALRHKRTYKPYSLHLIKFNHKTYLGTNTPRDYSSEVRIIDPERGEEREVLISMNDPLRYRGETYYQSSFLEGDQGTILQVVRNPGWLMPYISCGMVTLGMLIHFGISLVTFGSRTAIKGGKP